MYYTSRLLLSKKTYDISIKHPTQIWCWRAIHPFNKEYCTQTGSHHSSLSPSLCAIFTDLLTAATLISDAQLSDEHHKIRNHTVDLNISSLFHSLWTAIFIIPKVPHFLIHKYTQLYTFIDFFYLAVYPFKIYIYIISF